MKTWRYAGIGVAVLMAGCGGGGGGGSSQEDEPAKQSDAALVKASTAQKLEAMVKGNLKEVGKVGASYPYYGGPATMDEETLTLSSLSEGSGVKDASGFSTTNTQESGVDESDKVKFDGEYLFITESVNTLYYGVPVADADVMLKTDEILPGTSHSSIRVMRADPQPPMAAEVASIDISDSPIKSLYLRSDEESRQLAVIGGGYSGYFYSFWDTMPYWSSSDVEVDLLNVSDPANSTKTWSLSLDGALIDSRRIENKIYLVSRYQGNIEGFVAYPSDQATADHNTAVVEALQIETLLPKRRINGGEPVDHVSAGDCLIPNETLATQNYVPYIVTVTTIDMDNPDAMQVTCYVGPASSVYASLDNLYILDSQYEGVDIHKFAFEEDGTEYRASGKVGGSLGWNNQNLRLSEYNNDLRVVTSSFSDNSNRLFVLREDAGDTGKLAVIGSLPNDARPETIGKPGEQLYGVRFFKERGYAVTFKKIDPLYVLDLSDPADPFISGALEIPGYSDYLQPLGDNLLLGIGKDAVESEWGTAWYQGVKIGLFNIADPADPQLLSEEIIGKRGTETPVLSDYHALTLLDDASTDKWRVAIPVVVHGGDLPAWGDASDPSAYYPWINTAFKFYEINAGEGVESLTSKGEIVVEDASGDAYLSADVLRSVIQQDAVHVVYGSNVWSAPWGEPQAVVGPQ